MQARSAKNKPFTNEEVKDLMHQAFSAIEYIHKNGFMHRDLKPENFLVKKERAQTGDVSVLKLADFGLARSVTDRTPLTEYVSTRWYRAPELVIRSKFYNLQVDVFALGCIMAELYLGRPLFPGRTEAEQLREIISVLGTPTKQEWPEGYQNQMSLPQIPKGQFQKIM